MDNSQSPITDPSQRLQGEGRNEQPPRPLMSLEVNRGNEAIQNNRRINNRRRRNRGDRLPPHEVFKLNQKYLANMYSTGNYKRFFVITPEDGSDLGAKNTIKANRDLERILGGEPKKITELREGKLLIEVQSEQQSIRVREIKKLHNTTVTVTEHNSLNSCKGTIIYSNKPDYSEIELCEELKKFSVTEVKKIKRRDDTVRRTELYILTFDQCNIPEHVKIGWTKLKVREYIPKPRRCFQCQRWGHGAATCRAVEPVCMNCGEEFHGKECTRPPKCANCAEEHPALSKQCFYYRLEEETLNIKYKEKVSYREAKEKATERFVTPGETYASALQKQTNKRREVRSPQIVNGKENSTSTARSGTTATTPTEETPSKTPGNQNQKQPNVTNTIDIGKNCQNNKQPSITNTIDIGTKSKLADKGKRQEDSGTKRQVSDTDFEAENIATIVNFHSKDKKPARDNANKMNETAFMTEGTASRMDVSSPSNIRHNAPSHNIPPHIQSPYNVPLPPLPPSNVPPPIPPSNVPSSPAIGGAPPQGQRNKEGRSSKDRRHSTTDKRTANTTVK